VRLTELTLEALKGHLTRQMEQMKRFSNLYEDQGLTFTTERNASEPYQPQGAVFRAAAQEG
jgi:hypothetical protein